MNRDEKISEYIAEFVYSEKQVKPNPYLSTRIMAGIDRPERKVTQVLRFVSFAACIGLVIVMGQSIGNSYNSTPKSYAGLNINDSEIEHFTFYNPAENE